MLKLRSLETSSLVDMLAKLSADYSVMLNDGTRELDFYKCKLNIKAVIAEIETRKEKSAIKNITDPNLIIPNES